MSPLRFGQYRTDNVILVVALQFLEKKTHIFANENAFAMICPSTGVVNVTVSSLSFNNRSKCTGTGRVAICCNLYRTPPGGRVCPDRLRLETIFIVLQQQTEMRTQELESPQQGMCLASSVFTCTTGLNRSNYTSESVSDTVQVPVLFSLIMQYCRTPASCGR